MRNLRKVTVVGLGLLGGSICLAISRALSGIEVVSFSHRASTRAKARKLNISNKVFDDIRASVANSDLVILATPICTFEDNFKQIADALPAGCIVTDVGSTKALPQQWAQKLLPKTVHYVGSHPIAGSEQRGVEFSRDDLFEKALCILSPIGTTHKQSVRTLKEFWSKLGCFVKIMPPAQHDRIFADVSHLPHITAAALVNASDVKELIFAGKGFMDSSRIASGPANIWADVLMTNRQNVSRGIDRLIKELAKIKKAIRTGNRKQIETLLNNARTKRGKLVEYKMNRKELI